MSRITRRNTSPGMIRTCDTGFRRAGYIAGQRVTPPQSCKNTSQWVTSFDSFRQGSVGSVWAVVEANWRACQQELN
jgi:hypothetical protein